MIDKWLKAGVLEDGLLRHATEGSPQGGVISPCLSNIFLHHVLDEWFGSKCGHHMAKSGVGTSSKYEVRVAQLIDSTKALQRIRI